MGAEIPRRAAALVERVSLCDGSDGRKTTTTPDYARPRKRATIYPLPDKGDEFMAIKTYAQQLEDVQNTIAEIEAGGSQSYSVFGRSVSRADLATLYARERYLRSMVLRETDGGIGINYVIPERN